MSEMERRRQLLAAISALGLSLGLTVAVSAEELPKESLSVQTDQVKVNSRQDKVNANTVKLNTGQVKINSAQDKVNACCIKVDSTQQKGAPAPPPR